MQGFPHHVYEDVKSILQQESRVLQALDSAATWLTHYILT